MEALADAVDTFTQLADGKLNGQKAFMTGALKVKGNIMLAVSTSQLLSLTFIVFDSAARGPS